VRHDNHAHDRPQLYRVIDALRLLKLSRTVIYEQLRSGRLRSAHHGRVSMGGDHPGGAMPAVTGLTAPPQVRAATGVGQGRGLAIVGWVGERLAIYLAVLGLAGSGGTARLAAGQFHDVVLAGEVAYRFPRDEQSRVKLPAAVALLTALGQAGLPVPMPLATGHLRSPLGRCHVPLTRLSGQPLGQISGRAAEEAVVTELARLLDRLAGLGSNPAIRDLVPRAGADHWAVFAGQVRRVLYPLMSGPGRRRASAELAALITLTAIGDALVHHDLGGANLLWATPAGVPTLAGVLDWDDCRIGDQASDLASIAVTTTWPLTARIDARRRSAARPMLADAKIIAATFALQQALSAALHGDQASLDDGLKDYR
jgi:aminoglycoside phosphotransferase (APT) family kinase protein